MHSFFSLRRYWRGCDGRAVARPRQLPPEDVGGGTQFGTEVPERDEKVRPCRRLRHEPSTTIDFPLNCPAEAVGLRPIHQQDPGLTERPTRKRRSHVHRSAPDRKSTRLNSSHVAISYAVFCLKTTS